MHNNKAFLSEDRFLNQRSPTKGLGLRIVKEFATLQIYIINILQNIGKNNYKIPHMKHNDKLNCLKLSTSLPASKEVITNAIEHLESNLERIKKILKSNK
jgi:hypothetical protein